MRLSKLAAAAALLFIYSAAPVHAQATATVVKTCGTVPVSLPLGSQQPLTMDQNGLFCGNTGASSATIVAQGTPPWRVNALSGDFATGALVDVYNGTLTPWDSLGSPTGVATMMNALASIYESGLLPPVGAVTTGAPTYTTGTNANISLTPAGGIRTALSTILGTTTLINAGPVGTGSQRIAVGQDATTVAGSTPDPCSVGNKSSVIIAVTSATTTSLVAVSGTTAVYVCGFSMSVTDVVTTANIFSFEYGTGAACTGTHALTGLYNTGAVTASNPTQYSYGGAGMTIFSAPASNGICMVTTIGATAAFEGVLTYVQQ